MLPKKLLSILLITNFSFYIISFGSQLGKYLLGWDYSFINYIDLNHEKNIPTLYSGLLFFASAIICFLIYKKITREKYKINWLFITIIFIFLGIDEMISIHEKISSMLSKIISVGGFLHFKWVLIYVPFFFIIFLVFIKFFMNLDKKTRTGFFLSAIIFVSGAVGFELLGGYWAYNYGQDNLFFAVLANIEELLELVGLSYFIYYAYQKLKSISI